MSDTSSALDRLALAVVVRALRDCQRGDAEALDWLLTDGETWLDWLGVSLSESVWRKRVRAEYGRLRNVKAAPGRGVSIPGGEEAETVTGILARVCAK